MSQAGKKDASPDLDELFSRNLGSVDLGESEALLQELASVFFSGASRAGTQRMEAQPPVGGPDAPPSDFQHAYQILVEQIPAVVFLAFLDQGLGQAYISPQIENVLGYSREEWLGDPVLWFSRLHPDDKERWSLEAAQMLLSGDPLRSVYRVMARDGRTVWLQCDVRLVRRSSGEPWLVHGVAFDVTELKEAQEELIRSIAVREQLEQEILQSQKLESVGTLTAGLAHDFNNILTIILGYARRLTQHGLDAEKVKEDVEAITTAASRGARLIQQLLTFARKTPVEYRSLNLNQAAEELVSMIRETFPKTITLALDLDPNLPSIQGDSNQVSQLLLNVAVNARDAMPKGGTLSIRTAPADRKALKRKFPDAGEDGYVALSVSDTGLGMGETVRSRVFEPFFTTKETGKGTGLGLAVVYGIMQSHRGLVDIESALGRGSTFHFYFPVQPRL